MADKIEIRARTANEVPQIAGMFRPLIDGIGHAINIFSIDPEGWMPRDTGIKALAMCKAVLGAHMLNKIGRKVGKNMMLIASIQDLDAAIKNFDNMYHYNHRLNGRLMYDVEKGEVIDKIGHYTALKVSDTEITVDVSSPYQCEFDIGLIEEYFKKFVGERDVIVQHKAGSVCRAHGGDICNYTVSISNI